MSSPRSTINVAHLPPVTFDARDPTWWGNVLLLMIETSTVALLVVIYFYLRQANKEWPPPQVDQITTIKDPVPNLGVATVIAVLLLGSCWPMYRADGAARAKEARGVWWGVTLMTGLAVIAIALQCYDLSQLKFTWDENAYGSVVWTLVGLHVFYLYVAAVEAGSLVLWIALYGLDESRAVDVTLMGLYWYWTVAIWMLMYAVVYWSPRLL